MFPDTKSTPSETRVLMGSINLRRGSTLLAWLLLVLVSLIAVYSLYQMNRLGLLPASVSWDEVSFFAYTKPFEPARALIPVTGALPEPVIGRTYVDHFTLDTGDWSALQGSEGIRGGSLELTPNWLEAGGVAVWNLPEALLSPSFIFSADVTTQAKAFQRIGLLINALPDGSGLLLLIEPDTGKAAIYQRTAASSLLLSDWQVSPTLLPAPNPNRLEVACDAQSIVLRINGVEAVAAVPPLPCNQGQIGFVVLTPGLPISVDNVSLSIVQ